jgi:ATP adenylyltransferase/5',5'''-P-1,P-4-tetraphosphate phosphorylase II
MRPNLLLSDLQLEQFSSIENWSDKVHALLMQQEETWELLRTNYNGLKRVETRTFEIEGFTYRVQFNPGRMTSSSAKVDEKSIRERKCFLCADNLPDAQRGLQFGDYLILCNPFPIFPEHFTIPYLQHIPQEIRPSFPTLLQLSKELEEGYTVFYNGPKCGASAPDHLHFQAGNKGFMPIDDEYENIITSVGEKIGDAEGLLVFAVGDFLRRFISFESDDAELLTKAFNIFYDVDNELSSNNDEPMMNILSSYQEGEWRVIVFPRAKHRPSFFFEEGENKILISPAGVDFGGVVITPVERDFRRLTEEHLVQMFSEVSISADAFATLVNALTEKLANLNLEP